MVLGIYGSGGLGREVLELARCIQAVSDRWEKIVFIDDFAKATITNGADVLSFSEFQGTYSADAAEISIAIGEPIYRKSLSYKSIDAGYSLAVLVHPTIIIPESTEINPGVTVCANSFVSPNAVLEINSYVQPHVQISHDCVLGKHSVVSPSASIAGNVIIGECSYIGLGAIIKEQLKIGSWVIIGMGSVVFNDICNEAVAIGNPARVIKRNTERRVFK